MTSSENHTFVVGISTSEGIVESVFQNAEIDYIPNPGYPTNLVVITPLGRTVFPYFKVEYCYQQKRKLQEENS